MWSPFVLFLQALQKHRAFPALVNSSRDFSSKRGLRLPFHMSLSWCCPGGFCGLSHSLSSFISHAWSSLLFYPSGLPMDSLVACPGDSRHHSHAGQSLIFLGRLFFLAPAHGSGHYKNKRNLLFWDLQSTAPPCLAHTGQRDHIGLWHTLHVCFCDGKSTPTPTYKRFLHIHN